jgi:uncharacterized protein YdhG (YjbR/CyaY superfamily)
MSTKEIDAYLMSISVEARKTLEIIRVLIKDHVSAVEETISYKMPVFKYKGRPLAGMAAFPDHCSFFPFSPAVLSSLKSDLVKYETSKGTIHFEVTKPLPASLVKKLLDARMAEIDKAGKRKK